MIELKKTFEILGFTEIKTLLNSGNVVFSTVEKDVEVLTDTIETKLEKEFTFKIPVMIRTSEEIQSLVVSDPFKQISITPETRLYVTFLSEKPKSSLKIPYESEKKDFGILHVSDSEICNYLIPSAKRGSVDVMSFIEKEFGKNVTTRNWNTVLKIAAL